MADHVTKFKHPKDPPTWISHYRGSWSSKRKERLDCLGKLLDVQPGNHLQGYEHKERLEHSTQRQIFNVKLEVQHLSWPDIIAYSKSLL